MVIIFGVYSNVRLFWTEILLFILTQPLIFNCLQNGNLNAKLIRDRPRNNALYSPHHEQNLPVSLHSNAISPLPMKTSSYFNSFQKSVPRLLETHTNVQTPLNAHGLRISPPQIPGIRKPWTHQSYGLLVPLNNQNIPHNLPLMSLVQQNYGYIVPLDRFGIPAVNHQTSRYFPTNFLPTSQSPHVTVFKPPEVIKPTTKTFMTKPLNQPQLTTDVFGRIKPMDKEKSPTINKPFISYNFPLNTLKNKPNEAEKVQASFNNYYHDSPLFGSNMDLTQNKLKMQSIYGKKTQNKNVQVNLQQLQAKPTNIVRNLPFEMPNTGKTIEQNKTKYNNRKANTQEVKIMQPIKDIMLYPPRLRKSNFGLKNEKPLHQVALIMPLFQPVYGKNINLDTALLSFNPVQPLSIKKTHLTFNTTSNVPKQNDPKNIRGKPLTGTTVSAKKSLNFLDHLEINTPSAQILRRSNSTVKATTLLIPTIKIKPTLRSPYFKARQPIIQEQKYNSNSFGKASTSALRTQKPYIPNSTDRQMLSTSINDSKSKLFTPVSYMLPKTTSSRSLQNNYNEVLSPSTTPILAQRQYQRLGYENLPKWFYNGTQSDPSYFVVNNSGILSPNMTALLEPLHNIHKISQIKHLLPGKQNIKKKKKSRYQLEKEFFKKKMAQLKKEELNQTRRNLKQCSPCEKQIPFSYCGCGRSCKDPIKSWRYSDYSKPYYRQLALSGTLKCKWRKWIHDNVWFLRQSFKNIFRRRNSGHVTTRRPGEPCPECCPECDTTAVGGQWGWGAGQGGSGGGQGGPGGGQGGWGGGQGGGQGGQGGLGGGQGGGQGGSGGGQGGPGGGQDGWGVGQGGQGGWGVGQGGHGGNEVGATGNAGGEGKPGGGKLPKSPWDGLENQDNETGMSQEAVFSAHNLTPMPGGFRIPGDFEPPRPTRPGENRKIPVRGWTKAAHGKVPIGAFSAGTTEGGKSVYVGRAPYVNGSEHAVVPGMLVDDTDCLSFDWKGEEYCSPIYEILVGDEYTWVYTKEDNKHPDYIIGGYEWSVSHVVGICRARIGEKLYVSKAGSHRCYIFASPETGGYEQSLEDYDCLIE